MIARTPEEQEKDARRRRWALAIARGLGLGGACALVGGWTGFVSGLAAGPLVWVDAWGQQRKRPTAAALLALVVGFVWLIAARLQGAYMATMSEGMDVAFEAVRLQSISLLALDGPLPSGPMLVAGALVLALPAQLDRSWTIGFVLHGAAGAFLILLAPLVFLMAMTMSWLGAAILMTFYMFADSIAAAVLTACTGVSEVRE